MKKIIGIALLMALPFVGMQGQKTRELTILHTNDTHSCILPLSVNLADTMLAGKGGFLRRIAMLKEEREKDPDLLYFDSGDFSQGSSYYSMYKGDVEVGLMNQMGIEASTIGNHEFDFGLENMARIFKMATFPILCSNYDFTGTVADQLFGDQKYLKAAKRFSHKAMIDGMQTVNTTFLDGKHANTQVPKYIGFERIYEADATQIAYRKAAENFWQDVAANRTVCIGGNSVNEHFLSVSNSNRYIDQLDGPESCNSNNMLKLSEMLSDRTHNAMYADF